MKCGIAVTGRANPKLIERLAVEAERAGYDYFLVTDHFMLPNSNNHIDVWSFLPYLAAKTVTLRLGTAVTPITFRPPGMLAKMAATTDYLSGGRLIVGVGFGWYRPEFEGYSEWHENRERIAFSLEAIELMRRLWTEPGPVNFNGKYVHAKSAALEPKPIQKQLHQFLQPIPNRKLKPHFDGKPRSPSASHPPTLTERQRLLRQCQMITDRI